MKPAGIQVSQMRVGAVINTSSGGCDSESEAEMLDLLKGANVSNCTTWCGESDQIERAFAEVAAHKTEVLVVLGGDGTIRTAAEACTGTDIYLLPLPGGTLNVLPRALYGDSSWQQALKETLANPLTKEL
jgi:diacylglycerol kinase family enzyme